MIRAAVGPERLIAITGNDALTGLHRPEARLGPRPRAGRLAPDRARPAAEGLPALPPDRRLRPRQGRRFGHDPLRPCGAGLVARGPRRARDRSAAGCHRPTKGPTVTGIDHGGGRRGDGPPGRHAGRRRRRRPGGERRRGRGGRAGHRRAVARDVGRRSSPTTEPAAVRARRPGPRVLPRGARTAGT